MGYVREQPGQLMLKTKWEFSKTTN